MRQCRRHGSAPCTCEMGNLYRFIEPILLVSLVRLGSAHGYQLAKEAERYRVTEAELDIGAVYRTLRRLEFQGYLTSAWNTDGIGAARRTYALTEAGRAHALEWVTILKAITASMQRIIDAYPTTIDNLLSDERR